MTSRVWWDRRQKSSQPSKYTDSCFENNMGYKHRIYTYKSSITRKEMNCLWFFFSITNKTWYAMQYTLVQLCWCEDTSVTQINAIKHMIIRFQRQMSHCCHHKATTLGTATRWCTWSMLHRISLLHNLPSWVVFREATLNVQAFHKV